MRSPPRARRLQNGGFEMSAGNRSRLVEIAVGRLPRSGFMAAHRRGTAGGKRTRRHLVQTPAHPDAPAQSRTNGHPQAPRQSRRAAGFHRPETPRKQHPGTPRAGPPETRREPRQRLGSHRRPNGWGVKFTTEDIDRIAAEGFDHIRVPVAWHFHLKPEGQRLGNRSRLARRDRTGAPPRARKETPRACSTGIISTTSPMSRTRTSPASSAAGKPSPAISNPGRRACFSNCSTNPATPSPPRSPIRSIRKPSPPSAKAIPTRIIVVSPGHWGIVGELEKLRLPDADDRIVVTFHCYEPFHFTHQGAGWVGFQALARHHLSGAARHAVPSPRFAARTTPASGHSSSATTRFPATRTPARRAPSAICSIPPATGRRHFGRPVHLGEFGAHNPGDHASRSRYLRDVRDLAEQRNIPWTLWEWKSGFGYWDPRNNQPLFRDSLFE